MTPSRMSITATDRGIIGRALEASAQMLGCCHVAEEGPNAGWLDVEGDLIYDEDLRCRADCPVCAAAQQVDAARVALGGVG